MPHTHQAAARPVRVERDGEGLRLALLELLEEGFRRGKLAGSPMDLARQKEHIGALLSRRSLSAGYYVWAQHILRLDAERSCGLALDPHSLAGFEGEGLRTLAACRNEHAYKHPACGRCGALQESRHHPRCTGCGADFGLKRRK